MPSRSLISSAVSVSILSSLRGPLVHPRPNLGYLRVDLFERITERGQRLEQVVPMKSSEVDGAGVPGVFEKGQPGPHSRGPQAPFLGVIGFSKCRIDVFREDMEPPVEISLCASRQPALDIIATRKAPFGATSVRGVRGYTSYSMRRAYFWRYAIR